MNKFARGWSAARRRGTPALMCCASFLAMASSAAAGPVVVVVDMDADRPGVQPTVTVPPGTTVVHDVTPWLRDPSAAAVVTAIGYFGGIDRGIAFGHQPANLDATGRVTALEVLETNPAAPGHFAYAGEAIQKAFSGPEFQFIESGPAAPLPSSPAQPIVRMNVRLTSPQAGDVFRFHLADGVRLWLGEGHGAFSTQETWSFDSGGDSVPDGTPTVEGIDADSPVAVPPASFLVDYIDGPNSGGGATIRVANVAVGDGDADGDRDLADCVLLQQCFGAGGETLSNLCARFDHESDGDVDIDDGAAALIGMTGP